MPRTLNRAEVIGYLGDDPELRYTGTGTAVASLSVATDESYTRDGDRVEQTEWHDVTCWAGLAETVAEHLSTGDRIYAAGPMETNEWEMDGQQRSETFINADEVIFLGSDGAGSGQSSGGQPKKEPAGGAASESSGQDTFEPDDQLPF
jgi:single-strand DNA-binding protein